MIKLAALVINFIFYLAFPLADGPVWCKDSLSYTTMDYSREPLYPLFLRTLRVLFRQEDPSAGPFIHGQQSYLFAAVILQAVLAAVTVWILTCVIYSLLAKKNRAAGCFAAAAANLSMWGVQLLNRFGAQRASTYEESIMTEGLGISLYILFMICVLLFERTQKLGYLAAVGCLIFLCVSLRKQLMVTIIIFACVLFIFDLCISRRVRLFIAGLAVCAAAYIASGVFDCAYNQAFHGTWAKHTGNAMGIDCVLFYTADREDLSNIEDEEARILAEKIMDQVEEQGLRYVDTPADADWVTLAADFADAYDVIGYNIMNPVIDEYLWENRPELDGMAFYQEIDVIEGKIRDGLFRQDLSRFIRLWWFNLRKGMINSLLRVHPLLNKICFVFYCMYAAMLVILGGRILGGKRTGSLLYGAFVFGVLVLGATLVNSAVVGALIFPQTRYMIYNMGLLFTAFAVLAAAVLKGGGDE